jgi:methylenetetrahydrofolate dehydrogenase (NADP+)/methenyltetrahydrofolate cyclohydrolase
MAQLLDGRALAADVHGEVAQGAAAFAKQYGRKPTLRVVLVGDHSASASYVRAKARAAAEAGLDAETIRRTADLSEGALLQLIEDLNRDRHTDGILVQLPLPGHVSDERVIHAVAPEKDVDGFHPENVGRLAVGAEAFWPCTPAGIVEMLKRGGIETSGKHAVVLGRSNIVGRPMANLLMSRGLDATVTVCHSRTRNLPELARSADILVAAIGRPRFVTADMVKPGAAVIDVGINRVDDASRERGYRLVGDVDFEAVEPIAGAITPVPGGVGPMTIAMLLQNTLRAAERREAARAAALAE